MKNVWTILRRDLSAYFTSPIGYIVMIVFLAISVGLYMTTFFAFPVADMRGYFANLPLMLCILIPAITMRVWAEERKENTWEMLLTFPMKSWELVLGKFLATFAFFGLIMACTFTIPIMLASLGNPDMGAIFSGYLGTLLLGAFFLAVGIFFSGFCKDQIVAFVVTLLACFLLFLLGTNLIAGYIENLLPEGSALSGLGVLLMTVVGIVTHFDAFTRGVIELSDILFFLAWTIIFLALNVMYIDARSRPGARAQFATAVTLCLAIGLLFNWLVAGTSLARFDMTEDKVYTISPASRAILSRLEDEVQINLYITPRNEMPVDFARLEQDVLDKLSELRIASGNRLNINTLHLRAANVLAGQQPLSLDASPEEATLDEAAALEERMLDKGIEPFPVQTFQDDAVSSKLIYSHIGIAYRDRPEEIIPQIVPGALPELEYRLVSSIYKLTREEPPVVVVVAPEEAINIPEEQRRMLEQFGQQIPQSRDPFSALGQILGFERYEYVRSSLTQDDPLPEEFDTLVVANPRALNDRQRYEIARALASGRSVVMAVQNFTYDYRPTREGLSVVPQSEEPGVNDLLAEFGLGVSKDVLMDINTIQLNISTGDQLADLLGGGRPVDIATHILLTNESMNPDISISSRLANVFYLWGSALEIDEARMEELGLAHTVLMSTTPNAANRTQQEIVQTLNDGSEQFPVAVFVEGQFPDVFAERGRPEWPEPAPMPGQPPQPPLFEDAPQTPIELAPGKLVLIGSAMMWRDDFITMRGFSNLDLFLNSVDAVSLTDEIVDVRGRRPIDRIISRPADGTRRFWQFINFGAVNAAIAGIGLAGSVLRKRSRDAYTVAQSKRQARSGGNP